MATTPTRCNVLRVSVYDLRQILDNRLAVQPSPVQGEVLSQPKIDRHTAELVTSFEQGRAAGLEEAVKSCEFQRKKWAEHNSGKYVEDKTSADDMADDCIAAIHALNKHEPTA